ncbi:hypothetical protein CHLRE_18g748947v5 [Chlamydomonas reinhardtii]|uniref:Sugar phosphate transporter domain-containing protein n=1 Tax=Chlamydomonas reinhardtii TaxID=3055 RepID=A0A2K3CNI4_CHLRE|nr:uncharacterized protein CHLRE_18g748947v5 [Chlamydomonas reinhardtii]PNW69844.1 hypothetical protein CHLRE_18g748947v5 [Chlamydomonas reinhardtii]
MRIAAIDVLAWVLNVASSVAIVFVNKWLMDPVRGHGFVFATCLSAAHFLATGAVCYTGELLGLVKTAEIPILQLMLYTAVASASIASVNLSLLYNSVGFYQISKLATIPVVAALEAVWCGRRFSTPTLMSMAAVAIGSGIVTISDVSLRFTGFVIAAISVVTAALQQIGVGALQRQNAVGPVETLAATAPVQGMCLAAFGPSIDYSLRRAWVFRYPFTVSTGGILALSCVVALLVNLSQFMCLGRFSAATFQVMSHTKTISVLLLGWAFMGDVMSPRKVVGVVVAVGGMVAYSHFASLPLPPGLADRPASGWGLADKRGGGSGAGAHPLDEEKAAAVVAGDERTRLLGGTDRKY